MANTQGLQRFQVGGCVRDALLLRPSHDRDWVVVGATHDEMLERGFVPVGKSFCVYIDPETGHEYALARTEKKVGVGHTGFEVETDNVTLEEDLGRRDFTINSMAIDPVTFAVIDPFGGQADLKNRVLRATNPNTFADDPLRVFRAARLAAVLDFEIDGSLIDLAHQCVTSGELSNLSVERIYREATRAMLEAETPSAFWRHLRNMGALGIFPEINMMIGVQHGHEEGDVFTHTMMVLDKLESHNERTVWAALLHDVGKIYTPRSEWPRHHNHEVVGTEVAYEVLFNLRAPRHVVDFVKVATRQHMRAHVWRDLRAGTIVDMLGAMRTVADLYDFFAVFDADSKGRFKRRDSDMELWARRDAFRRALIISEGILGRDVLELTSARCLSRGLEMKKPGPWVGEKLHQMRVEAVKQVMKPYREKA